MQLINKYFDSLTENQIIQFEKLDSVYKDWNCKINVISRKDINDLYLKHVLHSLSIGKLIEFKKNTSILDVGTRNIFQ